MKITTKKEIIYVALAATGAASQLTWIQMSYNDPSFIRAWSWEDLSVIVGISALFVIYQTLVTWKAYLSDPNVFDKPTQPTKLDEKKDV